MKDCGIYMFLYKTIVMLVNLLEFLKELMAIKG